MFTVFFQAPQWTACVHERSILWPEHVGTLPMHMMCSCGAASTRSTGAMNDCSHPYSRRAQGGHLKSLQGKCRAKSATCTVVVQIYSLGPRELLLINYTRDTTGWPILSSSVNGCSCGCSHSPITPHKGLIRGVHTCTAACQRTWLMVPGSLSPGTRSARACQSATATVSLSPTSRASSVRGAENLCLLNFDARVVLHQPLHRNGVFTS